LAKGPAAVESGDWHSFECARTLQYLVLQLLAHCFGINFGACQAELALRGREVAQIRNGFQSSQLLELLLFSQILHLCPSQKNKLSV